MIEKNERNTYKIVICGAAGSGKTQLVNRIINSRFKEEYEPTEKGIEIVVVTNSIALH